MNSKSIVWRNRSLNNRNLSQGQLLLEMKSGLSKDDFTHAIIDAIKAHSDIRSTVSSQTSTYTPPSASPSSSNLPTASGANLDQNARSAPIHPSTEQQNSSTVQDLLQDRRQRLEAEKKEKDAIESANQRAKAEIRREAVAAAPDSAKGKQASYARQQRRRQEEEKLERERIKREIEHDKTVRREKEERRRALVEPISGGAGAPDSLVDEQLSYELSNTNPASSKVCALQVRLFDGSTIRKRFASSETLRNHVRPWIDEEASDGDKPFTFKQILYPVPNRTISISDEDATLQSLGFMPSATLVKIPVQRFSDAYVADQGIISRGISASYNVAIAGVNVIADIMGTILGFGSAISRAEESAARTVTAAEGTEAGVDTGSSRRQRPNSEERQFYNGNQVCKTLNLRSKHVPNNVHS
ncbi:hypothetical protein MMC07_008572 [Pseudocyphellaria aurata]|nr:hypothetical protein [Pseudocyphellaria aurata]